MKKYLYFPIILSLFVNTSFGQSNSFVKKIPGSYYYYSVMNDFFGTYLVSYADTSYLPHLARLDNSGNVLWDKIMFNGNKPEFIFEFYITISSNYYTCVYYCHDNTVEDSVIVTKVNFYGDQIISKKISLPFNNMSIAPFTNGDLLIAVQDYKKIILVKLDPELNIAEKKYLDYNISYYQLTLIPLENNFIINTVYDIGLIDSNLNYIHLIKPEYPIVDMIKTRDGNIIYVDKKNIYKIDINGNNIWTKTLYLSFSYARLAQLSDNNIVCLSSRYTMFSENGNVLLSYPISYSFISIAPTLDNSIIGVSSNIKKLDSEGNFYYLSDLRLSSLIYSPYNNFSVGNLVNIDWISGLPGNVQIELSTDNGITWEVVAADINAKIGQYGWVVPDKISQQCKIRIISIDFPQYIVESSNTFSIVPQFLNYIAINNHKMYYDVGKKNPDDSYYAYLYWPGGEHASISAIYSDGLYWSGTVNNEIRVGGKHYITNLQGGNIISPDSAADPNDPKFQPWRFRKDWESLPDRAIKSRYQHDYEKWPIELGAHWIDNNYDGIYNVKMVINRIPKLMNYTGWL